MENIFKIMIIDDDWEDRKETYHNVLSSEFEIIAIEDPTTLFISIQEIEVDGYLVDIVLNKWKDGNGKPQELIPVLESIKHNKPISLVSREYGTLLEHNTLTSTITEIISRGLLVNSFFVWSEFEKEAYNKSKGTLKVFTQNIENSIKLHLLRQKKIQVREAENSADIGIICALSEELEPILDKLEEKHEVSINNIQVTRGIITTEFNKRIRVVASKQGEMGTVDAALIGTVLSLEFKIKHLFMTGVCGGRTGQTDYGDIIIPHEIDAYHKGKITDNGLEINLGFSESNVNEKIIFENKRCEEILKNIYEAYMNIQVSKGETLGAKRPKLKFHEIACGDNVINKTGELEKIALEINKPKLCGIDMESYAIYRLNKIIDVKTLVLKSVMDLTANKTDNYKDYAAFISANFLIEVLKKEIYKL